LRSRRLLVDFVDARIYWHSLRVRILGALMFRPASAVQLAGRLAQPLSKIVYHTTILCNTGYARLAEGQDPDALDPVYEAVH
jgi:hypothetical protein